MDGTVKIKPRKRPLGMRIWNHKWFYLMFLPVLIAVIVFHYMPMFGIRYAFTSWNLINDPIPVGFDNFTKMFGMPKFWQAFTNTLEISVLGLLLNTFMSVIISLLLNEMISTRAKKLAQTIVYLPHFMSWVVTAGLFNMLMSPTTNGLLNELLIAMGLIEKSIYFLGEVEWWRTSYYIINIWHNTGWGTIIFMATLTGIDPGIYEAASIDGAGRWKKMWYITLPSLANTIITVLILNLAKVMNLFESVFVLQNDAVGSTAEVLQTYVYNQTFNSLSTPDVGYTTAIGLFRSLVGMFLVLVCNYASKKVRGRGIV
ncbi:MAG: sugar ABC transporter permease [Clostridia bacterium]|nr:sugar ABC transporter permease [Clostridia bacterium]